MNPQFGVEMTGDFRARLVADRFVAQDDPGDLDFILNPSAAMVGEAGIVVADDPHPVELTSELRQQLACAGRQTVAAEGVVEAVAETVEPRRAGALDLIRQ